MSKVDKVKKVWNSMFTVSLVGAAVVKNGYCTDSATLLMSTLNVLSKTNSASSSTAWAITCWLFTKQIFCKMPGLYFSFLVWTRFHVKKSEHFYKIKKFQHIKEIFIGPTTNVSRWRKCACLPVMVEHLDCNFLFHTILIRSDSHYTSFLPGCSLRFR